MVAASTQFRVQLLLGQGLWRPPYAKAAGGRGRRRQEKGPFDAAPFGCAQGRQGEPALIER
jgi:hypothetical protein